MSKMFIYSSNGSNSSSQLSTPMDSNTVPIPIDIGTGVGAMKGFQYYFAYGVEAILEVFIVVGNLIVIASIVCQKSMRRTKSNRYILSLAVSDLLCGLAIPIVGIATSQFSDSFIVSVKVCVTPFCVMVTFFSSSIFNLTCLSFDRYLSITQPLKYHLLTPSRSNVIITLAWVCAVIIGTTPLYWHEEPGLIGNFVCKWDKVIKDMYIIAFAFVGLIIPTIIILLLYRQIYKVAVSHSRQRDKRQQLFEDIVLKHRQSTTNGISNKPNTICHAATKEGQSTTDVSSALYTNQSSSCFQILRNKFANKTTEHEPRKDMFNNPDSVRRTKTSSSPSVTPPCSVFGRRNCSKLSRSRRSRREKRTTFTILLVVLVFLICWLPFLVVILLEILCTEECNIPSSVHVWTGLLCYANSGANPVIYTFRTDEFRKTFKGLLLRVSCCEGSSQMDRTSRRRAVGASMKS
ncbi:alpha-2 adrenergic receptor-like [Antedon mediterranea]|uniref:alpha-2 adrenergic receptor-like n=1 Tax=Antedon mediterranea TaxID=105859 RepID=UPI003AF8A4A2